MTDAHTVVRGTGQAFIDACELSGLVEILRTGNEPHVVEALSKVAATAGVVRTSLLTRMNVVTCRHYVEPRKSDFSAKKVFDLLESDDLRNELLKGKDDRTLEEARFAWRMCLHNKSLPAYLQLRHKHIAHLADIEPNEQKGISFGDIFRLTESTIRCFLLLAESLGLATTDLEFEREYRRKDALEFWSKFLP